MSARVYSPGFTQESPPQFLRLRPTRLRIFGRSRSSDLFVPPQATASATGSGGAGAATLRSGPPNADFKGRSPGKVL